MKPYSEFRPTTHDTPGLALPDRQDWLVAPCCTNRDAGVLQRANWEVLREILATADPSGEDYEEHSFGHWACGHFEIILVRPGSNAAAECEKCEDALSDYSVLSEEKYSELEHEEVLANWDSMSLKERVARCSEQGDSIFAARRGSPPKGVYDWLRENLE